jgi:hypothetical protein
VPGGQPEERDRQAYALRQGDYPDDPERSVFVAQEDADDQEEDRQRRQLSRETSPLAKPPVAGIVVVGSTITKR